MKPINITKQSLLFVTILSFAANISFILRLFYSNFGNSTIDGIGLVVLVLSCTFIIGIGFYIRIGPPRVKNNFVLFGIALILYNVGLSGLFGHPINLFLYCSGLAVNMLCNIYYLIIYFTWDKGVDRADSVNNLKRRCSNISTVKHSFACIFIGFYIVTMLGTPCLFIMGKGPGFIEEMIKPGFIAYILVYSFVPSLFFARVICNKCIITLDRKGISAINNFSYGYVSERWNDIERVKIINLLLVQIIVIYKANCRKRPWLNHFSFTPNKITNAIKAFRPDMYIG